MASSLSFGIYFHAIAPGSDNVFNNVRYGLPDLAFELTATFLILTGVANLLVGAYALAMRTERAHFGRWQDETRERLCD